VVIPKVFTKVQRKP